VRYLDSFEIDFENRQNMFIVAVGQKVEWIPEQFWAVIRRNYSLALGVNHIFSSQSPYCMKFEMYTVVKL
jgi:hypothetical protein